MIVLKESLSPQVGVFFYIDGKVIANTGDSDIGGTYGLHGALWSAIKQDFPKYNHGYYWDYLKIPRGRVSYLRNKYDIEIGSNLNKPEIIYQIMQEFGLSKSNTTIEADNSHYELEPKLPAAVNEYYQIGGKRYRFQALKESAHADYLKKHGIKTVGEGSIGFK